MVFLKFRWLELLYLLSGHIAVLFSVAMFLSAISSAPPDARDAFLGLLQPYFLVLTIGGVAASCAFSFATICSAGPILLMLGHPELAERVYRFTLSLRRKSPGKARINFWNISIANCLREQGRLPEAELLYQEVIDSPCPTAFLDQITNYGLTEAAAENYAHLLSMQNRTEEAARIRAGISGRLTVYALNMRLFPFWFLL